MDNYFILAAKHLCFTLVKVGLLESVWSGSGWRGRKATIPDLRDIKMLQQCILIDALLCQRRKTQSPGRVYKMHCPQGKHGEKRCMCTQHTLMYIHTHVYTHTHVDACTRSCAYTRSFTCMHTLMYTHTHIYTCTLTGMHVHTLLYMYAHTNLHAHTHVETQMYMHGRTQWHTWVPSLCQLMSSTPPLHWTVLKCLSCFIAPGTQDICRLLGC